MKELWTCLIRIKTKEGYRSHLIEKQSFTLGRTQEADLPIVDPSVSRVHVTVMIKDEFIWISDHKSANGTYLNDDKLQAGENFTVRPEDTVRLGTLEDEFQFFAVPKPFELLDLEAQKGVLLTSMSDVAHKIEARSRQEVEREVKMARLEGERMISHAKKEAEVLRTNELADAQKRKQELDVTLADLLRNAQNEAMNVKLAASKEADRLVTEAQKSIREDYEDSNNRIEVQLKSAQTRCIKIVEDAELRATTMLSEAREESGRVRLDAAEESRRLHQEALRKSRETMAELQDKVQSEVTQKKVELLELVKVEADKDRDRIGKEHEARRETLKTQRRSAEEALTALTEQNEILSTQNEAMKVDYDRMRSELAEAIRLKAEVDELEKRRFEMEKDLKEFASTRNERMSKLDTEVRESRQKALMDLEGKKGQEEAELAKARLVSLEKTRQAIEAEEKRYEQSRRLRAVELSQKLNERFLPELEKWAKDPSAAALNLKQIIETEVKEVLVGETSSIHMVTEVTGTHEKRAKATGLMKRIGIAAVVGFAVAVFFSGGRMFKALDEWSKDTGANQIIEKRRRESIYAPQQTNEYHPTYTDNILYMKGYFDTKTDPNFNEKWTLKLNDIAFLKPLGLSEENIVGFVAKETNLVQRLGSLRGSIDAVYLQQGIDRMRAAEDEDVASMKDILHGDENYKKIRAIEEALMKETLAMPSPASVK